MRASVLFIVVATASVAFSGCLDGSTTGKSGGAARRGAPDIADGRPPINEFWAELALVSGGNHNHKDRSLHQGLSTPNFEVLGYNPLITDYHQKTAGGYFCSDTVEKDGRRLSVVHSWVTDVALVISDVTNASDPKKLGELVMANTHVYDLAMTKDQRTVLLATSPGGLGEDNPPVDLPRTVYWHDACTGQRIQLGPEQGLPFASGIVVVDITNPRVPQIVDFRPFPINGGHSVTTEQVGNQHMVLVSVPNGGPTSYYVVAELQDIGGARRLVPLSYYQYRAQSLTLPMVGPAPVPVPASGSMHDGLIHIHPITKKPYGYLAYGGTSLVIVDLSNPRDPQFVSRWADWSKFGRAGPTNPFVHEALPMDELWDGKHYTFIGEECGGRRASQGTPTCLVALLDTTDPAKPSLVGGWTLPIDVEWSGGLLYSLHYIAVSNRTLFVSNYHGGLWAVDVSTPEAMRTMPSIGVFLPDEVPPKGLMYPDHQFHHTPVILDVNPMKDGTLVVYDGTSGLYLVKFDKSYPAPAPKPWPLVINE